MRNKHLHLLCSSSTRIDVSKLSFVFVLVIIAISCGKKSDAFTQLETTSEFDFHAIEYYQGNLYATGGDIWNKSDLAISSDGITWQVDSFSNKSIFDLHSDGVDLFAVGNDGYIFRSEPELTLTRTKHWGMLRGFGHTESGYIGVGGKDFNKGWIYKTNDQIEIDTTHQYNNELSDVKCLEQKECIAVGYGIILVSTDNGNSWVQNQQTGDFYNSIAYNTQGIPYIVGYSGSILFSDDHGQSWKTLRNGHSPTSSNKPFRKIKFIANQGFIVGDNGLIWHSSDSGKNWADISINTKLDLFDFHYLDDQLIIVSEMGNVILYNIS